MPHASSCIANPPCQPASLRRPYTLALAMSKADSVIQRSPEVLAGTPVFAGTRVPLKALLDYLAAGQSMSEFLDDFPTVTREQAIAALQLAKEALLGDARSA